MMAMMTRMEQQIMVLISRFERSFWSSIFPLEQHILVANNNLLDQIRSFFLSLFLL